MRVILTKTCNVLHYCYYNICGPIVTYCTAVCGPIVTYCTAVCGPIVTYCTAVCFKEMLVSAP